jgi:hypothetical protein
MKNSTTFVLLLFLVCSVSSFSQQEKGIFGSSNWLSNWTEFKPIKADYKETNQIVCCNITSNTTWSKKNTYLLQGAVYVSNGAVLTIEPGTVIRGDSESCAVLVVSKGATINAVGTETDPIVFTSNKQSRKAGDWGGVIILGDAPINKFGGTTSLNFDLEPDKTIYGGINPQSNSGVFKFVRIEFAGKKLKGFKEFNSLSLAGVGNKTVIENVMCSYSGDDSFEVYGGEVNFKRLVSYRANDDDFHFTQGAQSNIDNSLAVRNPFYSNASSRCIQINSYEKKSDADFSKKQTAVVATNCTFINDSETLPQDIAGGLIKEGIYVAENTSLTVKRSVISGFFPAVVLSSVIDIGDLANLKKIKFDEVYFNNCTGNIFTEFNSNNADLEDWYGRNMFLNVYSQGDNKETFIDIKNQRDPDFRIQISKIVGQNK